jgi:hypothetical protein
MEDSDEITIQEIDRGTTTSSGCCDIIRRNLKAFVKSLLCPRFFIAFNIICIIQTVPALYYYISFYQKGFFIANSSGMPPVWGATIGAICSVIVTTGHANNILIILSS